MASFERDKLDYKSNIVNTQHFMRTALSHQSDACAKRSLGKSLQYILLGSNTKGGKTRKKEVFVVRHNYRVGRLN